MSILTPFFNLFKPAKTDPAAIEKINENMDIIDTEMHRPPLTVNNIEPDPTSRNIPITTVPLADNLTSSEAQLNEGTYIIRSSGGEASISNGSAWLNEIQGNMVKTGETEESITGSVTVGAEHLEISIDRDTFVAYVDSSTTIVLDYTNAWSANPALYGITVVGTPVDGDQITVVYVKANRGTITTANPSAFISTGWNLYNYAAGYARVVNYSEEYGFMIEGTYTALAFAETISGTQTEIEPINGFFTLPAGATSGYLFVTGGNATNTEIWMTWADWTEEANGGVFEAYTQSSIDLSEVMVLFPYGLMRVGNYYDEINLNTQRAYSRIERLTYNDTNLAAVIASGVPYDTDTGYIFAVKEEPDVYVISVNGEYTVSDHGTELFAGTTVPLTAQSLYGNDLKGKLQRGVVTISQQTLTANQKEQVRNNIGAMSKDAVANNLTTTQAGYALDARQGKALNDKVEKRALTQYYIAPGVITEIPIESNGRYFIIINSTASSLREALIVACSASGAVGVSRLTNASSLVVDTGTANKLKITNNATNSGRAYVENLPN